MRKNYSRTKNSILNVFSSFGGQILLTLLRFITRTVFISTLGKTYLGVNGYFADIINGLPRKILGYKTPDELFDQELDLIYSTDGAA